MSHKFETPSVSASESEPVNWDLIKSDLVEELQQLNNPNLEGIDYDQLTEEDLDLWRLYRQWQTDGSGLTVEIFRNYQNDLRTQDIEGHGNVSSFKLLAYLADRLTELFYPRKK